MSSPDPAGLGAVPREKIGLLLLSFGEPVEPTLETVRLYLERIFQQNLDLESHEAGAAMTRVARLAGRRAPRLLEAYLAMGGSPLNAQADAQADALEAELTCRGWTVRAYSAFQFTAPTTAEKVAQARAEGVERLVVLPVYPLCGRSTTVAALAQAKAAIDAAGWAPSLAGISGWHHHPRYVSLRVENVRRFVEARGLDLTDSDTLLYFSAHGTPLKYLNEGSRYDRYVEEHTRALASRLGTASRYAVGFQNHSNRNIEWTQPDNEDRIRNVRERRLIVVPVSFMHEQSETLAELDDELREFAEGIGKEFHRVPVPHDDPAFVRFLADLVTPLAIDGPRPGGEMTRCRCTDLDGTWCTNGARELSHSPYAVSRS